MLLGLIFYGCFFQVDCYTSLESLSSQKHIFNQNFQLRKDAPNDLRDIWITLVCAI